MGGYVCFVSLEVRQSPNIVPVMLSVGERRYSSLGSYGQNRYIPLLVWCSMEMSAKTGSDIRMLRYQSKRETETDSNNVVELSYQS